MNKNIALCFLGIAFLFSTAEASINTKIYKEAKKVGGEAWKLTENYINGVGVGLVVANGILHARKQDFIYCPPENLTLNSQNYISIIDDALKHPNSLFNDEFPIEFVLARGLQDTFPCEWGSKK